MKVNLARYALTFAYITLFTITMPTTWAGEAEDFVAKLKTHYQQAPPLKVFALNYHYLGGADPYKSWDYQAPDRYLAIRMVELDLINNHFVENDIHHFYDGRTFNRTQFQNDNESLFYDKNGISLGKRIRKQGMDSFEQIKGFIFLNVDFLAVTALLEESNIAKNITIQHDKISGKTCLTHTISADNVIDYVFNNNPLKLAKINNKSKDKIYVYDDYQTTNGITFARSIVKYYGGVTRPSFIHRIDQLHIIDKIDPARFQVPKEFGPIIPPRDNTLLSKEIAPNLHLVTNSAASRNVLFKVSGDEIMVFGASANTELAEQTIKLILAQFPNKKISAVYVTHPHSNHIKGLPAYAKRGIKILAEDYSIEAIKAYPPFADDIETFKFQAIEHEQIIAGAHFYVLENSHAKRQSFVHFKDSGIIYQADFLAVAFDNTIAKVMPNYSKTFIDFVRSEQLNISRIVGSQRNNNISVEVMNKIYQANR